MSDRLSAMDRPFVVALTISLACHVVLCGIQVFSMRHHARVPLPTALEVMYEPPPASLPPVLHAVRARAALNEGLTISRALAPGEGAGMPGGLIRVPERPIAPSFLTPSAAREEPTRSAVVDLGNVADAAQGNPVLLSYFVAIRDQIQRTANRQTWMANGGAEGLVYVSFVLSSTGQIQSVASLQDRSIASSTLQEMAVRIVKSAGPFAPFPPSVSESTKTVVIPLEFLLGQ